MRRAPAFLLLATTIAGCYTKSPEPQKVPLSQAQPGGVGASAAGPRELASLTGSVVEQLRASPYIYLRLKTAEGEVWTAVNEATIKNGATVTVYGPLLMTAFETKTLKRTFDQVYFGSLRPTGGAGAASAAPAMPSPAGGNPHASVEQPAAVDVGKVEKATGADAHTVAEVWSQKTNLTGKTVTIRGMVVKYNDNVMGKNWIHLQDGSGNTTQGTNDITVTSSVAAVKGETITVSGTVRTNRDFGAGYSYAVIVEDAKIARK